MEKLVEQVLGYNLAYDFERGPREVRSFDDARRGGLNCVALAHLVVADQFGVVLPDYLQCTELFFDRTYTKPVRKTDVRPGDLAWLGRSSATSPHTFMPVYHGGRLLNWDAFPINHVGIVVSDADEPMRILNASQYDESVVVSSLEDLQKRPRYSHLHGLSRVIFQ